MHDPVGPVATGHVAGRQHLAVRHTGDLLHDFRTCRTTDALDTLRRAIAISDRSRAYAKDDSDFDPIRDEPAFKELIGP